MQNNSGIVSFRNAGRLGNFLYMAAHGYAFAKKHGLEFSVPHRTHDQIWSPIYLPHLRNKNYIQGREDVLINEQWTAEKHFQDYEMKDEWRGKQIIFNGYNQSYKYFDFCRQDMIRDFGFHWERISDVVAIHVRRGDCVFQTRQHPVVTMEYLIKAVEIFALKGFNKFKIFSDDIKWCMTCGINLHFPNCQFEYSVGKNEVDDLIEMSCMAGIIASNSTYSIWAAELNQNKKKIVVVPSEANWFGPDIRLSVKDLYRPEWIEVAYEPIWKNNLKVV